MDKTTKKGYPSENGTGFDRPGASSKISALPRSSNASLGISGDFVQGTSTAVSNLKTSKEMNSGASVKKSSNAGFGIGSAEGANGTVAARENAGDFGTKGMAAKGEFGLSAKRGSGPEGNPRVGRGIYGSGARAQGTDGGGYPDAPGGSMANARKGLSASTGGVSAKGVPSVQRDAKNARKFAKLDAADA